MTPTTSFIILTMSMIMFLLMWICFSKIFPMLPISNLHNHLLDIPLTLEVDTLPLTMPPPTPELSFEVVITIRTDQEPTTVSLPS